ncbi:MAG: ATP-binding protein [Candidatus Euphemobacter frigidus]|nr:ATP-binding protein [Candidatus Euphemobacter frigidus]MDP8275385.1 ATP-binding protein [Candidatus Euphemobacter frigidus]
MNTSNLLQQLMHWSSEDEHLEFKEAKQRFDFERLVKYCCALANEGGGRMILGITNKRPRRVVGTLAFSNLQRTKSGLIERLHLRIDAEEIRHPDGRVLIFHVPSRPLGTPLQYKGAYWMRRGEDLVPMLPDMLRRIFNETGPDFSHEICPYSSIEDLDPDAITEFRKRWVIKSGNRDLEKISDEQLLCDVELISNAGISYAALILMGRKKSLARLLPNAEVIFEYRSRDASIDSQQRVEFREGFFLFHDRLWELINLRNDIQHFRDGLFLLDIPTFNEEVVREAILNAACHRDYRHQGSVFIRQYPKRIVIESPGGFPEGISEENLLYRQHPRNRIIAEALAKAGLVERAGQGFDKIYTACCRESKPLPDFTGTDNYWVFLTLNGAIQDQEFLRFLEKIGDETQKSFTVEDFLTLHYLRQEMKLPENLTLRLQHLLNCGVIEKTGRGRGTRHILSKRFYILMKKRGDYTTRRGLDRETNKELIIKHLKHFHKGTLAEFKQVLPSLTRHQIYGLLRELKKEGRVRLTGKTRGGHWELL